MPMAVVDRMGSSLYATGGRAAQALARYRLPERLASDLAGRKAPAWVYLHGLKSPCPRPRSGRSENKRPKVETAGAPCLS